MNTRFKLRLLFFSQQSQLDIGFHAVVAFLLLVQKYCFEIGQNIYYS